MRGIRVTRYENQHQLIEHMPTYQQGSGEQPSRIEPGLHKVIVIEGQEKISQAGNDVINMKMKVIMDDGTQGPTLYDNLVFTAKAAWKIDLALKALGFDVVEGRSVTVSAKDLEGMTAMVMLDKVDRGYWVVTEWIDPDDPQSPVNRPAPLQRPQRPQQPQQGQLHPATGRPMNRPDRRPLTPMSPAEAFDDDDIPF